jgi:hypothetical protein
MWRPDEEVRPGYWRASAPDLRLGWFSWKFEGLGRGFGKARVRFRVREAKREGLGLE